MKQKPQESIEISQILYRFVRNLKDCIGSIIGDFLINEDAIDAYYQGVLPLNTLANAVLRKYDEQQRSIQENYDRQMKVEERREKMIGIK